MYDIIYPLYSIYPHITKTEKISIKCQCKTEIKLFLIVFIKDKLVLLSNIEK